MKGGGVGVISQGKELQNECISERKRNRLGVFKVKVIGDGNELTIK